MYPVQILNDSRVQIVDLNLNIPQHFYLLNRLTYGLSNIKCALHDAWPPSAQEIVTLILTQQTKSIYLFLLRTGSKIKFLVLLLMLH